MTREQYMRSLSHLRDQAVQLSSMVDKAIARSTEALKNQDVELARQVMSADHDINELRWSLEEEALAVIAMQAPMAGDLRQIVAGLHIISELERMGDHAAGNAKIVLLTADEPPLKPLVDIPRMSGVAQSMLSNAIDAYIGSDVELARQTMRKDDEIDELYNQVYRELLSYMVDDPRTINRATHLLWAAHNLERIGDRTENICEFVIYSVTGNISEAYIPA
ncbi:MAG: phosphate signaling complex protein PhoU [Thermomicrobiales bacterium]|nr:MAG: phosphate signaling complex protein PhoU [Thermomicrobiales bacterium]